MPRRILVQRILLALVLALGLGVIWALMIGTGAGVVAALRPSTGRTSQRVLVAADGTPLIRTQIANNYLNTTLRTLDGQTIELEHERWLGSAYFAEPYRPPRLVQWPITWKERFAGCSDFSKPPVAWVLVRDDRRPGHAYFAGYDSFSKVGLGNIGRRGFRATLPPSDEWFDLGNATLAFPSGAAASSGYISFGSNAANYYSAATADRHHLGPWLVYLLDGETIQEVNLRDRQVRSVASLESLLALAVTTQPLASPEESEPADAEPVENDDENAADEQTETDAQAESSRSHVRLASMQAYNFFVQSTARVDAERKTTHRLLARCADRIVKINPFDGTQQDYPLPEELRSLHMTVYTVDDNQLLLQIDRGWWEHGNSVDLYWLNTAGEVARKRTIRLANYVPGDPRVQSLGIAAVVPSLLPWMIGGLGVGPFQYLQTHESPTYAAAVGKALSEVWAGLVVVILLSILLAAIVHNWHRKYCRSNTAVWTTMVLLTTLPGFFAYWVMHRRPPLERCSACGGRVPRDRDACAQCDQLFAEPSLLSTSLLHPMH